MKNNNLNNFYLNYVKDFKAHGKQRIPEFNLFINNNLCFPHMFKFLKHAFS